MATKKAKKRNLGGRPKKLLDLLSKVDNEPMPTFYPTIPLACAAHGITVAELKRARDAACPAFRSGKIWNEDLAAWLVANPHDPPEDDKDDTPTDATTPEEKGAGRTLERMEAMEVEVHAKIKKALPADRPAARLEWLKVARELLRFDKDVKDADKASGRTIPQSEAIEMAKNFIAWQRVGTWGAIRAAMPALSGAERTPQAMAAILIPIMQHALMTSLKMAHKTGKLPSWIVEAAGEELKRHDAESLH